MTVWYIGPESRIYHTARECPALNRPDRYWSITRAGSPPVGRRECALCSKRLTEAQQCETCEHEFEERRVVGYDHHNCIGGDECPVCGAAWPDAFREERGDG